MPADTHRAQLLPRLAEHMLRHGLPGASLRPLAKAAGTSDRMLIYHFGTKAGLTAAVLEHIAAGLEARLPRSDGRRLPFEAVFDELSEAFRDPALAPYHALWVELVAAAIRDPETYRPIAGRIADRFHAWIAARLDGGPGEAFRLLALLDGYALLRLAGRPET